jgi:pSer/pThr/pTyr-binding forkhead associated (FHA) protein
MEAELTIVHNGNSETRLVSRLPATLGRGQEADLRLEDPWVSRLHCILNEIDGTLVVRDLGAKNGTFVNGLRVSDSLLLPGGRLTLGRTSITVQYHPGPKTSALPACEGLPKMDSKSDERDRSDCSTGPAVTTKNLVNV